jgi:hypothetical protein
MSVDDIEVVKAKLAQTLDELAAARSKLTALDKAVREHEKALREEFASYGEADFVGATADLWQARGEIMRETDS